MKEINHICFIAPNYPTTSDPMYTFLRELVASISRQNIKCSVIAPQSITNFIYKSERKRPFYWQDKVEDKTIDIYQPIHAPFINLKTKKGKISALISNMSIKYTFKKYNLTPDVLYAHFWHSGVTAGQISRKHNIPFFVASGESKIWVCDLFSEKEIKNSIKNVSGVIAVSEKNKKETLNMELTSEDNITVIPNAINNKLFYKKDKNLCRKKLGYNENDFIIAFTGAFTDRKGVTRLSDAIDQIPDVKAIYIGSGELKPNNQRALHIGRLPHDKIVDYLNAADVFVLPTLAEGCSNAIIEAMACGLPIISSDLSFNDDILDEWNSIRVDPMKVQEIRDAIVLLKDNQNKRLKLGEGSIERVKNLGIHSRASRVVNFIEERLKLK